MLLVLQKETHKVGLDLVMNLKAAAVCLLPQSLLLQPVRRQRGPLREQIQMKRQRLLKACVAFLRLGNKKHTAKTTIAEWALYPFVCRSGGLGAPGPPSPPSMRSARNNPFAAFLYLISFQIQ